MITTKRRMSCPLMVQYFWDAIEFTVQQKNCPTYERVSNVIKRTHDVKDSELKRQLDYAVRDDLVRYVERISNKGQNVGGTLESYRMPKDNMEKGDHDWYCFECHRSGEVVCCSTCHRVYHTFCIKEDVTTSEDFVCAVCKLCRSSTLKLKVEELNRLLIFTCNRLNEKVSGEISYPCLSRRPGLPRLYSNKNDTVTPVKEPLKEKQRISRTSEECWRQSHLIYNYVDLVIMEEKAQNNKYQCLEEFQVDAMNMVHNVVIFYGLHSEMSDLAKGMLADCNYDLNEICQCKDCYRMSNEKLDQFWFCQVCEPPHELVYAKQTGFPYWPAKVIKAENDIYDVRFFGGFHQRANIEVKNIRNVNINLNSLNIKKSLAWMKAFEELKRHQQLLNKLNPDQGKKSVPDVSKRKNKLSLKGEPKAKQAKWKESEPKNAQCSSKQFTAAESDGETSPNEFSISSTTKSVKSTPTPEDYNVVSSSCQETASMVQQKVTIGTQTKRLPNSKIQGKANEEETDNSESPTHSRAVKIMRERLEAKHKVAKDRAVKDVTHRLEKKFAEEKDRAVASVKASFQQELDKMRKQTEAKCQMDHHNEIEAINENHLSLVSELKKKQWCYNCGNEAIYHCCWNTSYCSTECQQVHWQKEHKRSCRRKR